MNRFHKFLLACVFWLPLSAHALMTENIIYRVDNQEFVAYFCLSETLTAPSPGILLLPDSWGLTSFMRQRAHMLASQGYVVLVADLYGHGETASNAIQREYLSQQLMRDSAVFEARFTAALRTLQGLLLTQDPQIATIGYGTGGKIALHMARLGTQIEAAVSFHGLLPQGAIPAKRAHQAQILMFHGQRDHWVDGESLARFKQDMFNANYPYMLVTYPDAWHGFTKPSSDHIARLYKLPLKYDFAADQNSWQLTQDFLRKVFWPTRE